MTARLDPVEAERIMREDGGVTPLEPYISSRTPWQYKCNTCGAIGTTTLGSVKRGGGCRACGIEAARKKRRLSDEEAFEVMLKMGDAIPLEPYPGLHSPWRCKCNVCGAEVSPRLSSVRHGGQGACQACGVKRRAKGRLTDEAGAVQQMITLGNATPIEPFPGVMKQWKCRCNVCGVIATPRLLGVQNGQGACKRCGDARGADARRADDGEARQFMIAHDVRPHDDVPYPGALKAWASTCMKCGRAIKPRLNSLQTGNGGCRYCARHGFDLKKPAWLYVLHHPRYHAYKVGIAGKHTRRIKEHEADGWRELARHPFAIGEDAKRTEESVFIELASLGISRGYVLPQQMLRKGHTETFSTASIKREDLLYLVAALAQKHS